MYIDESIRFACQEINLSCCVHLDVHLNVHRWEYQACRNRNRNINHCCCVHLSAQSILCTDVLCRCTYIVWIVNLCCWHLHNQCSIAISMLFSIQNMAFMCLQFVQIQPLEQSPYWIWMCDCALRFISCVQVLDARSVLRKRWSWASTLTAIFLQSLLCDCECEYQNQMHPTCSDPSASRVHPLVCNHDSTRITSWTVILLDNQFIRVNDIPLEGKCLQNTKFKETYWCLKLTCEAPKITETNLPHQAN